MHICGESLISNILLISLKIYRIYQYYIRSAVGDLMVTRDPLLLRVATEGASVIKTGLESLSSLLLLVTESELESK